MRFAAIVILILLISYPLLSQQECDKYPENYIPINLDDAINYLDCKWSDENKSTFKKKAEAQAVGELHFGTGMAIRNNWGLWSGDSEISKFFKNLGVFHPDDMSGIILTSFHRYLNSKCIKLDEQVKECKEYWQRSNQEHMIVEKNTFNEFKVKDTVLFSYPFEFSSQHQEETFMNDSCLAFGVVLDKNSRDLSLQIKLIESCDKNGIISFKGDKYRINGDEITLIERNAIEYMLPGEIRWLRYDIWQIKE